MYIHLLLVVGLRGFFIYISIGGSNHQHCLIFICKFDGKKSGSVPELIDQCGVVIQRFFSELWLIQNRSLVRSISPLSLTFSRSSQKQNSEKTRESVSQMLAPALLLEVLLALGLLVVVPKSLLVVVPSLASVET